MNEGDLLAALRGALEDGQVRVLLDYARLMHEDSPIAVQADHTRWLYAITAAVLGLWYVLDWRWALAALILGVLSYLFVGRPWIHRRIERRFFGKTLSDIADFKKLWRLPGVTLTDAATGRICASPAGDWRRFVLDRLGTRGP